MKPKIDKEKEDNDYRIRKINCLDIEKSLAKTFNIYYQQINNITIIRDDLLCGGTKSRFVMDVIKMYHQYDEFVYISPWYGGAQIALSWGVYHYNSTYGTRKKATIFIKPTNYLYPYMKIAKEFGAKYYFYTNIKQVNFYLTKHPNALLVPYGFNLPIVIDKIAELGKFLKNKLGKFDEFYYACGSGTLIRGIQKSELAEKYYAICVTGGVPDVGDATAYEHYLSFDEIVPDREKPPFPSAIHYDAKAWAYVPKNGEKKILFWNVM